MKYLGLLILFFSTSISSKAQETTLAYFISKAIENSPTLLENGNLQKIGELQNSIIMAQNNAFQINATSEVVFAPYFNSNGRAIDVTTSPSVNAYGYDVGITNGGLYSAQLNLTKNLFNKATVANLLFQNSLQNNAILLSTTEIEHNLIKSVTEGYIAAYQIQLQEDFTKAILADLDKRLQVIALLVKRAIVQESDYLLLQLDIENKRLELQQLQINLQIVMNQLATICGIPTQDFARIPIPDISSPKESENYYFERKFENDSLLVEADKRVFANQYKPQLIAYGTTGLNAVELTNIERRVGLSAGIRLTIPIYDGKQKKYNVQQNELKKESLRYAKDNSKIQLTNNLEALDKQMIALDISMEFLEKQLQQQRNILEIYKGKLIQGQVSIIDYLNVIQGYKQNVYTGLQMRTNKWLLQSQYNFINR